MFQSTLFFDTNGRVTSALARLLELFGVGHDGTLKGVRDATQAAWFQAGKLRAEIAEKHGDKKNAALPLFAALGMIDAVRVPPTDYLYALVLGGTVVAVRKRLSFLLDALVNSATCGTVVLLGSERPLLAEKESPEVLLKWDNDEFPFPEEWHPRRELPTTEAGMMELVYDQVSHLFLQQGCKVQCVNSRKREGRNPTTRDTVVDWLNLDADMLKPEPIPGLCLAVSSQPFVGYQELVLRRVLPDNFGLTCVGYTAPSLPVTTYLDNVAKLIFEFAEIEGV